MLNVSSNPLRTRALTRHIATQPARAWTWKRLETVVGLIKSYNSKSLAFMGLFAFIHQFLLIGKGSASERRRKSCSASRCGWIYCEETFPVLSLPTIAWKWYQILLFIARHLIRRNANKFASDWILSVDGKRFFHLARWSETWMFRAIKRDPRWIRVTKDVRWSHFQHHHNFRLVARTKADARYESRVEKRCQLHRKNE